MESEKKINYKMIDNVDYTLAQEKKKRKRKNLILFIVVGLIAIGSILFAVIPKDKQNVYDGSLVAGEIGVLPGLTPEEMKEILQKQADASMFSFDINSRPTFDNGKSEGNVRIANPPYNTYGMKVQIRLDDTNDLVIETDMLKPNQFIENSKISGNLSKGEYPATAIIQGYDLDSGELQGEVLAALTLIIRN